MLTVHCSLPTWVDLNVEDLRDLLGGRYNDCLEGSHSGYDTDLVDGTVTGSHSPEPSNPTMKAAAFEELSGDIIVPPDLPPDKIPTIFHHYHAPVCPRR